MIQGNNSMSEEIIYNLISVAEEEINSLVKTAREQQETVDRAIKELNQTQRALTREYEKLTKIPPEVIKTAKETTTLVTTKLLSVPMQEVVYSSIEASKSVAQNMRDLTSELNNVTQKSKQVSGHLSKAINDITKKWVLIAAGVAFLTLLMIFGFGLALIAWQKHEIGELYAEKEILISEVSQLKTNALDWEKRGGKAELGTCGPKKRICVRVNPKLGGHGKNADYYILRGY